LFTPRLLLESSFDESMIFTIKAATLLRETSVHHPGFSMTYSDCGNMGVVTRMDTALT
jgi:hypothetical protein